MNKAELNLLKLQAIKDPEGTKQAALRALLRKITMIEGPEGPMGPIGPQGEQGLQGEQGESIVGPMGPVGPQGERGEQGIRGTDGQSIVGPQGIKGDKGDKGDRGEDGTPLQKDELVETVLATLKTKPFHEISDVTDLVNFLKRGGFRGGGGGSGGGVQTITSPLGTVEIGGTATDVELEVSQSYGYTWTGFHTYEAPGGMAMNGQMLINTGGGGSLFFPDFTPSRVLIIDSLGYTSFSTTTDTELGYVSGVTSAIQTQLDSKLSSFNIISPASFGTRQNNYNPTGLATASTIRLTATSDFVNITGIAGGYAGRMLILQNVSNFTIQLPGEDPNSSSANQFVKIFNSSEGIYIPPYSQTTIYYDGVISKWRTQYPGVITTTSTNDSITLQGGRYFRDFELNMGHTNNWNVRQNFTEFYALSSLVTIDIDNKRYVLNENEQNYFELDGGSGLFDLNASQGDLRLGDITNDTQKLIISPSSINNRTQLGNITAGHLLDIDTANNNTKLGNTSSGTYLEIDHSSNLYYLRGLPTSDPGVTGALWLNGTVIEVSP